MLKSLVFDRKDRFVENSGFSLKPTNKPVCGLFGGHFTTLIRALMATRQISL
jgi:hypothetical protein